MVFCDSNAQVDILLDNRDKLTTDAQLIEKRVFLGSEAVLFRIHNKNTTLVDADTHFISNRPA